MTNQRTVPGYDQLTDVLSPCVRDPDVQLARVGGDGPALLVPEYLVILQS